MAEALKTFIVCLAIMMVSAAPPVGTKQDIPHKKKEPSKWQEVIDDKYQNTYEINMWYRYAKYTAKSRNQTNCYVCSKMPKSGTNPHVVPEPVKNTSELFPECLISAYAPQQLNDTLKYRLPPPVDHGRLHFKNYMYLPFNVSLKMYGPVHFSPKTIFTCYENTVTLGEEVYVGQVPRKNCGRVYTPCTRDKSGQLNRLEATRGTTCTPYFTAPDALGTTAQTNFVWLCGLDIYYHLPTGWVGRCAPVTPADHTFIISAKKMHHREKRELWDEHDSVWGTNVPNDHKLWTNGQKVALALFPWLGTGKLMLQMETVDYRFEIFVNTTTVALDAIKVELSALRMMELQDRMVLDQLTASMGGVCALVNDVCCSFIPDFDASGQVIEQAINNLTKLRNAMEKDYVTAEDLSEWLFGGAWWQRLLKLCIPVISVLILICMCMTCVLPCLMRLMRKVFNSLLNDANYMGDITDENYGLLMRKVNTGYRV